MDATPPHDAVGQRRKGAGSRLCWFERDLVSAPGSAALDLIALGSVAMPSFVKAGYY
jgi:hypothetical protein